MSTTVSPSMGKRYGVQRVCSVLEIPRSSFYAQRERKNRRRQTPRKRGPKPRWSDEDLLALIKQDLSKSPFTGEGHRKVWARLKFGKGIRVGRKRVLRIMREHNLLSPYRRPRREPVDHEGTIVTQAPNVMWGTDGTKVFTVEEGYVWIFAAVEHWNAECMGWHACKKGDRYAALEPVAQGILNQFGTVEGDVARGLSLRMDHGTQYLSDHFQKQVKHWGIAPSFAFLEQPQTNGVAERFFRTLKEQVVYGRIFRNVEELRQAVGEFIARYNSEWRIEKNGFLSPLDMRGLHPARMAA